MKNNINQKFKAMINNKTIFFLFSVLFYSANIFAQYKVPDPQPGIYVNDYVGVLSSEQKETLRQKIKSFKEVSSIEIAVVILDDFQGYSVEDITLTIGRKWGVGQAGLNNGIVYLVSPNNRKARIEVGSGLQGELTDAYTSSIQDDVKQFYRNSDYYSGIDQVVSNMIEKLQPISWEQRQKLLAEEEKRSAEAMANFWNGLFNTLGFGSILGLFSWLIIVLHKNRKKQEKEKERLLSLLEKYSKKISDKINYYNSYVSRIPSLDNVKSTLEGYKYNANNFKHNNKFLQSVVDAIESYLNSSSIKQSDLDIECLILDDKIKSHAKNSVNLFDDAILDKIRIHFNKCKDVFKSHEADYYLVFENRVADLLEQETFENNFNQAIKQVNLDKAKLLNYDLDGDISKLRNEILDVTTSLTDNWKFVHENYDYYQQKVVKLEKEYERLVFFMKNCYSNLINKVETYNSKAYVRKSTQQDMRAVLLEAKKKYNDWKQSNETLSAYLEYEKYFIDFDNKIEYIYKPDYEDYEAKQAEIRRQIRLKEEDEERERQRIRNEERRKRDEEEADRRRRDSYSSSSTSSYSSYSDNSSSYGGGDSFSGGGFDGGGSSSSW